MSEEHFRSFGPGSSARPSGADTEGPTAASELAITLLSVKQGRAGIPHRTRRAGRFHPATEDPTATAWLNISLLDDPSVDSAAAGQKRTARGRPDAAASQAADQLTILLLSDAREHLKTEARKTRERGRLAAIAAILAALCIVAAATILESQGTKRPVIFIAATALIATLGTAIGFYLSLRSKQGESAAIGDLPETLFSEQPGRRPFAPPDVTRHGRGEDYDG